MTLNTFPNTYPFTNEYGAAFDKSDVIQLYTTGERFARRFNLPDGANLEIANSILQVLDAYDPTKDTSVTTYFYTALKSRLINTLRSEKRARRAASSSSSEVDCGTMAAELPHKLGQFSKIEDGLVDRSALTRWLSSLEYLERDVAEGILVGKTDRELSEDLGIGRGKVGHLKKKLWGVLQQFRG